MKLKISNLLQLRDIKVNHFKLEENINGIKKFILDADFTPFEINKDGESIKALDFILKVNAKAKNPTLKAELKLFATFDISDKFEDYKQIEILLYNGLSILYGIARGMILQGGSILSPQNRLLPAVDIAKLVKDKMEKINDEIKKNI